MSQQPTPREKTKCISRETAFQLQYRQHVGPMTERMALNSFSESKVV